MPGNVQNTGTVGRSEVDVKVASSSYHSLSLVWSYNVQEGKATKFRFCMHTFCTVTWSLNFVTSLLHAGNI